MGESGKQKDALTENDWWGQSIGCVIRAAKTHSWRLPVVGYQSLGWFD